MSITYGAIIIPENPIYLYPSNVTLTYDGSFATFFKTSGSIGWDTQVVCLTPYTAPCTIEFYKMAESSDNGISYAMIGWNADPLTDSNYGSIDWAGYPHLTDQYIIYNNGTPIYTGIPWLTNKRFYIVYTSDGYIKHYNGSTLLYSVYKGTGQTVYFDTSLYSVNTIYAGFRNVRIIKKEWNGTRYV